MNNLFTTENGAKVAGANQLGVTATLTNVASSQALIVIERLAEKVKEDSHYELKFKASIEDNNTMDSIIDEFADLKVINIDFLKEESESTLDKALKSQQSKRSRTKKLTMTEQNYRQLVTAAISEQLIRLAMGKPKGTTVGAGGVSTLTDEKIAELSGDAEAIGKAIRNIQSRKSIAKSKVDFDEYGEHYQSLLAQEAMLKAMRDEANGLGNLKAAKALECQEQLKELLINVDSKSIKLADAKSLINQVQTLLGADAATEEVATTTDETTEDNTTEETA